MRRRASTPSFYYTNLITSGIGLTEEKIAADFTYSPITNPGSITHPLGPALAHIFNHQTHHRGQCHAMLTALGGPSLALDLLFFLRSERPDFLAI